MRVKKKPYDWEVEVFCKDCQNVIIVEGPEELYKEIQSGREMFGFVCPVCGREIWFDGIKGLSLSRKFRNQIPFKKKN